MQAFKLAMRFACLYCPNDIAGLDSSTVALFVHGMARLVLASIELGEKTTLQDLRRVAGLETFVPHSIEEIVELLLTTCYTSTINSSEETRSRAERLAKVLGARHLCVSIDEVVSAHHNVIKSALNFSPRYSVDGGTRAENLALQNLQARNRMVVQYTLAQLATTAHNLPRAGAALLVLTSGNVVGVYPTAKIPLQCKHCLGTRR